ncbi:MAG: enolase C-terminal domain-like protein [Dongiaceae bacterium]
MKSKKDGVAGTRNRRGVRIHALSAIDIALHDLAGKQLGVPVHRLMGGARTDRLAPYATIFVEHRAQASVSEYVDAVAAKAERALALGFRALKVEMLLGSVAADAQIVDTIRSIRRTIGHSVVLMVDFGYRWRDWHEAQWVLTRIVDCDIYFAEATLQHDLHGHARLSAVSPIRICGGEWATTRWEVQEWITSERWPSCNPTRAASTRRCRSAPRHFRLLPHRPRRRRRI